MSRSVNLLHLRRFVFLSGALLGTAAGLIALLLVLAGVFQPKVGREHVPPTPAASARGPVAEVRLVRRSRMETAVGTVRPVHEAAVASKLLARVVEVNVSAGQTVTAGDVLVRLDDADLQSRLEQAASAVNGAESRFERARNDHARAVKLVDNKVIPRAEFDQIVAELKMAQSELRRTQQAVDEAKVLLDYGTIRSPLTGVVIDKLVERGDTATPGQVLLTLYEPNRMQLVATVRESLAERLKVGDEIPARLDALGHDCLATVSEIVPEAESASRSFTVKVTGPCPPGVYSGMFGRILVPLSDEHVLVVPRAAISRVGQLSLVDVVEGDEVRRRSVQLGRELPEGYEVLAGLREGEKVVLQPTGSAGEDRP
ncbi:MAG: efflux RND transporter periplasmic adaptor subunit [Pirellulales bacterium]